MNKCVICGKNCTGKTCSGRCRVTLSRRNTVTPALVTPVTCNTVTLQSVTPVTPVTVTPALPDNFGLADCACWHCRQNRSQPEARQLTLNHGPYKTAAELSVGEINRVSLPGDIDYNGVCVI